MCQLRQASSLTFEVIIECADVQTFVDLAVSALVTVHFETLLSANKDTRQ
jgi:hypothetical protein